MSVVMPARNARATIVDAVRSVLGQSHDRLELLVIDDGSTDGTADIVEDAFGADSRLQVRRAAGRGLVSALNTGVALASGEFIARLDADDLAHPRRLEYQLRMFANQPEIGLASTLARAFPAATVEMGMAHYLTWQNQVLSPNDIAQQIYRESPFVHSTVMFRRSLFERLGPYRQGDFPEDYELWLRWSRAGVKMAKVDRVLVGWRQDGGSASRRDPRYRREAFDVLRARYLSIDRRLHEGRPLVMWGAGRRTRARCRHVLSHGHKIAAWIDIDPGKIGNVVWGAPVRPPQWLRAARPGPRPFVLSYVANHGAAELIAERLCEMSYAPGKDYLIVG